jgi:hypothetical protein
MIGPLQEENAWRFGPELPVELEDSVLVEDGAGGVLLVGGSGTFDGSYGVKVKPGTDVMTF